MKSPAAVLTSSLLAGGYDASGPTAPMFQARCRETLFITDWGVPLAVALLLLGLIYLFIYLPASLHQSSAEDAVKNLTEKCGYNNMDSVEH